MKTPTIVVFGSTGTVGREVMRKLKNSHCYTRGIITSPSKYVMAQCNDKMNLSYMSVNFESKDHIKRSCLEADTVFLLTATHPNQVENEINIIDAAVSAGIKRIVKLSAPVVNEPATVEVSNWHRLIDAHLSKSNIDYCLLQPYAFMQNWERNTFTINRFGKIFGSLGDVKRNYIDCRDVADVAVKQLLSTNSLNGASIPLSGPESLTNYEIADRLSYYTGNKIKYIDLTAEDHLNMLLNRAKLPKWLSQHIVELDQLARLCPEPDSSNVEDILNKKARVIDVYLQEEKKKFEIIPWYKQLI